MGKTILAMKISPNAKVWIAAILLWIAVIIMLLLNVGCSSFVAEYKDLRVKRSNWIWADVKVAKASGGIDTNGNPFISFEGYSTHSDESIEKIVKATADLVTAVGMTAAKAAK